MSVERNERLIAPFSLEELTIAIHQMHPDKSPGPDGFNAAFFQIFWPQIRTEIFRAGVAWLNQGAFPATLNETVITLIPKK